MHNNSSKIEIIFIKYNQNELEARAIESIGRFTKYPNWSLTAYQNETGVGLATIWNRLIERSDAEYICLLNTDTVVTENWLTRLKETFDLKPDCGGVCPSSNIVGEAMKVAIPYDRMEPDINKINEFGKQNWINHQNEIIERNGLSGFCMMFKKKVWEEVGKFNEEFFMYGEDSYFSWKLKNAGHKCYWRKGVFIHHYGRQSTTKAKEQGEFDFDKKVEEATQLFYRLTGQPEKMKDYYNKINQRHIKGEEKHPL